ISMTNFSSEEWRQFLPEEAPLSSWSIEPETTLDRDEKLGLDLEPLEPGVYLLAARCPEGARDSQILVVTRTALTLKRTAAQALVWATSLQDGHPVEGLEVTLYDEKGNVLATGTSSEDGIFSTDLPGQPGRLHAVAEGEGGLSLCSDSWDEGIEPWRFEQVMWRWASRSQAYTVFLYTDRPAYSPGETVSFRAVLRRDEHGTYTAPALGTAVQMTAANSKGNVIYDEHLESSPFGTVHGAFVLNEEVAPGEYFLKAVIEAEEYRVPLRIEERGEEPFKVDVVFDHEEYMTGEVISATVSADYHFGVPVGGATVEYTVYGSDYRVPWERDGAERGSCDGASCWDPSRREIAVGRGVTNEAGEFDVLFRADAARRESSQVLTLEATVTELGGEQITGEAGAVVHRGEFYIDLLPESSVVQKGQRASVDLRTADTTGQYQADLELSYAVHVSEWKQVPRTMQGRTYWEWQEILSTVESAAVTTDGEGRARISFVPRQGGPYRVEAWGRDGRGNRVLASAQLWVSDPDRKVAWRFSEHDRIELIADKTNYQPDETARVLVQSPYERALGLVTVERGGILSHSVSELEGNSPIVEVSLGETYGPNVFVSVVLVPRDEVASPRPGFKVGYAELSVQTPEDVLRVSVTPDEEYYEPGQMASYTIRTRDYLGRPVRSEVSLEVVDASIQSDAGGITPDVVETFYGRRQLAVRTTQSLAVHVERTRLVEDYGGTEGVGEQEPRLVFPEVAYWNPAIVTDEAGMAVVMFQMPDSVTEWRALAKGVTLDGLVGVAEVEVSTRKSLVVVPSVPRILYVGDEAVITASIENRTGDTVQARVNLAATGGLRAREDPRPVVIGRDESVTLEWTVEAEEAGDATLTLIANADQGREVVQRSVSIQPFGERTLVLDAHVVQGEASQAVSVPAGAQGANLEIDLAPTLAAALIDSVEYLGDSPHDSVEQTVSRFLPGLELSRVLSEQGLDSEQLMPGLPGSVEASLQRLYRLQNRDGGWGWSVGDESQLSRTAYVILGLDRARRAGYEVNERVLSGGLGFLRQSLLEA
ncbi:MAG TPA: MG2 domain-containing protein, partial [Anaerolineae bacterium]|nr:MG2 domain-containing protein [Anaerolineae bacterium]